MKLKSIMNEAQSNEQTINKGVDYLIRVLKIKKYQLSIEKDYGIYFITLPQNAYKLSDMDLIAGYFPTAIVGYYPNVSKNTLSINTRIKY